MHWSISKTEGRFLKAMRSLLRKGWTFIALVAISGCATYRPMSITPETVHAGLRSPDMNEVRLQAGRFKHPLLIPVSFDVNGHFF